MTYKENIIKFYIREEPYGFLSNFWRSEQLCTSNHDKEFEDVPAIHRSYRTNEHFYQSMKARDPDIATWIANAPTAKLAMKAGRMLSETEIYSNWNEIKDFIMLKGLRAKFSDPNLRLMLLWTGDATLIEDSPTDMYWGGSLPGSQNKLGKLLMQVRDELNSS